MADIQGTAVAQYNATTGATIDAHFVNQQGLSQPSALLLDGNNHLFVANYGNNTVGEYDATTGATLDAVLIGSSQGIGPANWAGVRREQPPLFVANYGNNTIGEYDATTGATINATFISGPGLDAPADVLFIPVPEPGDLWLLGTALAAAVAGRRH